MAKATTVKIKLESTAGTGYYYVTRKNSRTMTDKMVVKKYDPVVAKGKINKEIAITLTIVVALLRGFFVLIKYLALIININRNIIEDSKKNKIR